MSSSKASVHYARLLTGALGCSFLASLGQYVWNRRTSPHLLDPGASKPSPDMTSSESMPQRSLSQDVVDGVLRDPKTIDDVVDLVKNVFTHPTTLEALKSHFKSEFTENEQTVGALQQFILRDVVQDQFASEQLIDVAKGLGVFIQEHPLIYPKATLDLLGGAALDALRTERFNREVLQALRESSGYFFNPEE